MGYALNNEETYSEILCGECGIVFYVPEHWRSGRHEDGKNFYCPNGHCRAYKETTVDTLRKELAARTAALAAAERAAAFERQRVATLDKNLTKERRTHAALKRRVAAGVCPCCQRTVRQLAAHMKTKHPEYVEPLKA